MIYIYVGYVSLHTNSHGGSRTIFKQFVMNLKVTQSEEMHSLFNGLDTWG